MGFERGERGGCAPRVGRDTRGHGPLVGAVALAIRDFECPPSPPRRLQIMATDRFRHFCLPKLGSLIQMQFRGMVAPCMIKMLAGHKDERVTDYYTHLSFVQLWMLRDALEKLDFRPLLQGLPH